MAPNQSNRRLQTEAKPRERKPSKLESPPREAASDKRPRAMAMAGATLLHAMAELMTTCTRRLQRAARRVATAAAAAAGKQGLSSCPPITSRAVVPWRKAFSLPAAATKGKAARSGGGGGGAEDTGGLWRKEILMGERCQPLDFSGVIYYDADGRRLAHPPPPRSPMRSPLPVSAKLAANAGSAY
ncbi:uncharacterized protein LOC121054773 [Oryza brachyantha]|uniref:uncharacterized protein LOC121054773 n=1 Tax=Oryza brachyantha TaxID=4533 RepID=UPI001ADD068C|nr:uncharacterized protein LOC121054773 [Oryza brachyantha]